MLQECFYVLKAALFTPQEALSYTNGREMVLLRARGCVCSRECVLVPPSVTAVACTLGLSRMHPCSL